MSLRELLFTPTCIGCRLLGDYLCGDCTNSLNIQESVSYSRVSKIICANNYEGWLRDRVIEYKSGNYSLCDGLAQVLLVSCLNKLPTLPIVPIPSTKEKIKLRQIDTIGYLANRVNSHNSKFKIWPILEIMKPLKEQVGQSALNRKLNLQGAFASKVSYSGSLILLDDVVTTGSTITSAALALQKAGAKQIFAAGLCLSNKLR